MYKGKLTFEALKIRPEWGTIPCNKGEISSWYFTKYTKNSTEQLHRVNQCSW